MPLGPGKYDDLCTYARVTSRADAALLIIHNGVFGHGFSMQTADPLVALHLPTILRNIADEIEASLEGRSTQTPDERNDQ